MNVVAESSSKRFRYVAGLRPSKKVTFSGRSNAWSNLSYSTVAFVANAKIVLDNTS